MHARLSYPLVALAMLGGFVTAAAAQAPATQAPQVTVGGVIYTQYQYTDAAVHNNTFDITRAYVNVLGRFTGGISTRVTADIIPSAVTNQAGGTGDFHKDLEARVSVRLKPTNDASRVGGLRVTGYAGVGKYGPAFAGNDRNRFLGQVSYKSQQFTLAGELVSRKDSTLTGSIISAFGVYHLTNSKIAVIGRIDVVDPNTNVANNKNTRIIGGVSYQLSPNVRLLADLDRLSFESGATATNQALFQAQFVF